MSNVYWGTHAAIRDNVNCTVLMIGDSWFWYPFDNLAVELGPKLPNHVLLAVGRSGAEAGQWATSYRKDIDFAFDMYGGGAQVLMLSGGGNDIAGMNDFNRLLKDDCSAATSVVDCFKTGEPGATITRVDGAYRTLIAKFRGHNPAAPVILHHYDYAWPTGAGVFGPSDWLKAPMDRAKVPPGLRRDIFKHLVNEMKASQLQLASTSPGLVEVALTAGVLPDNTSMWANELHPTPAGFRRLIKNAFLPAFTRLGIPR
jgi:hypothetical protein